MFPLDSKTHSKHTRMEEKYEVKHANTERLRHSAIIYMQNLVNEHERVCGLGLDLSSIVELGFGWKGSHTAQRFAKSTGTIFFKFKQWKQ